MRRGRSEVISWTRESIRPLRLPSRHGHAPHRGLGGEPQAGGADLEAGGAEGPGAAAEARSAVAQRRIVHPAEAAVSHVWSYSWPRGRTTGVAEAADSAGRAHERVPGDRGGSQDRDALEICSSDTGLPSPRTGVHREARAAVVGARGRRDAWENGYNESFNGKLRDELLNGEIRSLAEAAVLVEQWRREYNTVRPHSACGGFPPAPEAIKPSPWFLRMPVLHGPRAGTNRLGGRSPLTGSRTARFYPAAGLRSRFATSSASPGSRVV